MIVEAIVTVSTVASVAAAVHFHLRLSSLKTQIAEAKAKASQDLHDANEALLTVISEADAKLHADLSKVITDAKAELTKAVTDAKSELQETDADLRNDAVNTTNELRANVADVFSGIRTWESKSLMALSEVKAELESKVIAAETRIVEAAEALKKDLETGFEDAKGALATHIKAKAVETIKNIETAAAATSHAVCSECGLIVARFERDSNGLAHCKNCTRMQRR